MNIENENSKPFPYVSGIESIISVSFQSGLLFLSGLRRCLSEFWSCYFHFIICWLITANIPNRVVTHGLTLISLRR